MADTVFDRVVRHQIQVERAKAGEVKRINKIVRVNDEEILALISQLPENYTQRQINTLIRKINVLNKNYYKEVVAASLENVASTVVSFETDFSEETVENFLNKEIPTKKTSKKETLSKVLTASYDGHKLPTWVNRLAKDKSKRIERQIRTVSVDGGSPSKVATSAKRAIRTANSNNQAVTKAYVNQSVNFSRDDVYTTNDDKVEQILWSSILDGGTTLTCGVRSNKRYDAKTKEPIGHNNEWGAGPGLIHWGCRSLGIPVDKDDVITSGTGKGFVVGSGSRTAIGAEKGYERGDNKTAQGKRFKIPSKNNALERETVSGKTDYETWLKRQPKAFVEDAIGVTKADAFLSGKATLGDFVVQRDISFAVNNPVNSVLPPPIPAAALTAASSINPHD